MKFSNKKAAKVGHHISTKNLPKDEFKIYVFDSQDELAKPDYIAGAKYLWSWNRY